MKRKRARWTIFLGLLLATSLGESWRVVFSVQAAQRQRRSLPNFEVDRAWPKVPAKWKLGDASSIAIDAHDNVWILHRPRTLKPEQGAMARRR